LRKKWLCDEVLCWVWVWLVLSKSIEKNEKENTKKKLKLDVIEEIKKKYSFYDFNKNIL